MPILTADNRDLTNGAKYSYLSANYASNRTTLVVENSEEFKPDDFVLIGEFGSSYTEIRQISSIARATNTLTFSEATNFPHPESTKVTIINYDQVRFFHTATATFSATDPVREYVMMGTETSQFDITNPAGTTFRYTWDGTGVNPHLEKYIRTTYTIVIDAQNFHADNNGTFTVTSVGTNYFEIENAAGVVESNKTMGTGFLKVLTNYLDIDTSSFSTKARDINNSTGFGWFVFYNSFTASASQNSNAIPYAGFAENSVKAILDTFYSLLNNKELKLIENTDALSWLNEAYAIARNELNLVNKEYSSSEEYTVTVTSGIAEYSLPDNFSDLLSIIKPSEGAIDRVDIQDVSNYSGETRYYLRNGYIGFAPTPTEDTTYTIRHTTKTTALNSLYDTVDFPDNNFYCVKDYMMFRAAPKLNRTDGPTFRDLFFDALKRMKITSITRDSALDSWGIDVSSNI